ncbi:hypothetical protein T02_10342 [Trichinella nativa]|uniref:Uncharacterized protein n=1 Tax=Trichinella nativa TaxID=6335 RepID=A0A0V1LTG3_9BILA|nr:hypothetical protein T02_10342 [Trichinella nativa]
MIENRLAQNYEILSKSWRFQRMPQYNGEFISVYFSERSISFCFLGRCRFIDFLCIVFDTLRTACKNVATSFPNAPRRRSRRTPPSRHHAFTIPSRIDDRATGVP